MGISFARAVRIVCPAEGCENDRKVHQEFCWRCWHKLPMRLQLNLTAARQQLFQPRNLRDALRNRKAFKRAKRDALEFLKPRSYVKAK